MATASALQLSLRDRYTEALAEVCKTHNITNKMAAPRIDKVCLNMGVGRAVKDGQILGVVADHLTILAGQKSAITIARKAISNFQSREGMKIGARVTLRGARMWSFLDKLVHVAIPRIKDFRGVNNKGFDPAGNYNMGLREQALFPEIQLDKLDHNQGLNITVVFRNSDPTKSFELLKLMGMPFKTK